MISGLSPKIDFFYFIQKIVCKKKLINCVLYVISNGKERKLQVHKIGNLLNVCVIRNHIKKHTLIVVDCLDTQDEMHTFI